MQFVCNNEANYMYLDSEAHLMKIVIHISRDVCALIEELVFILINSKCSYSIRGDDGDVPGVSYQ